MVGKGGIRVWGAVALVLLPGPVVAAAWSWVQAHPIVAALWIVAYELVMFTASFVAGVVGPVQARWQQRLSESLYQASHHRLNSFYRRYRAYVAGSWESIDQRGLATGGFFTPALDDVFVDVSLTHRPPHTVSGDPLGDVPAGITERHSIWDFLSRPNRQLLAIVGGPGSGKTTLLRHTARQLCRRRRPRRLVVLLSLRDHATAIASDPTVSLADLLRTRLPRGFAATEPGQWFERRLAGDNCIFLLDGLDEIAATDHRKAVVSWVEQQVPCYPKGSFVVTSRPHGYQANPLNGFAVLQTRRLTNEQVRHFVHSWYLAAEKHSMGVNAASIVIQAREKADDLLDRLRRTPTLLDLTYNPLLLTMIANVHRYRGALPGSRAELYKEICEVLLWRRHEAKGLSSQLRGEQQIAVLREVAFHMMQQRLRDLPHAEVLTVLENTLPRYSSEIPAAEFLIEVKNNGLLVERENSSYAFAHLTFQEYLAAAHINEARQPELLAPLVGDTWWRETILLYTAQADATPVVEACLTIDTLPALALAFECAVAARALAPECRHRLDSMIQEVATTADPERRRLLAGVTVLRQLHSAVSTESGGRICTEPVTRTVYQLFLDETRNGNASSSSTNTADSDPVATTGPWGRDALAFIDWLNKHICIEQPVRLPRTAELAHIPDNHCLSPAWTKDQTTQRTATLWLPPDAPPRVDATNLAQHVTQDLKPLIRLLLSEELQSIAQLTDRDFDEYNRHTLDSDLVLERGHDRALARALAVSRDRVRDRDRDRDRDLDLDLDRYRYLGLGHDLANFYHDLAHDLARSLARIRDRHRDRDLDLYFNRAHARTHILIGNLDRIHNPVLTRDLALARDLVVDLGNARDHARDLGSHDLSFACDRARALVRTLNLALILARDPDSIFDLDLAPVLVFDLDRHYPSRVRGLVRDFDLDLTLDLAHILDLSIEKIAHPSIDQVGIALFNAISAYRHAASSRRKDRNPETQFSQAILQIASEMPAATDHQIDHLWDAIVAARDALGSLDGAWGSTVADRLVETAQSIFNRERQITSSIATVIRLPALCLAVEAEQTLSSPELAARFRELVAAITLLERYATGQQAPNETILLTRD